MITASIGDMLRLAAQQTDTSSRALAFTLAELMAHRFPARRAILTRGGVPVLREGHLAEVFAERGIGKTWFLYSLALAASAGGSVLGFEATTPVRTLIVDGEMASEDVQSRLYDIADNLGIVHHTANLTVLAADWQLDYLPRLDTLEGQSFIAEAVDLADLIIIDNRSSLFDPEGEKDATAWQPAQDYLLSLRRRGKAVILAHHSNRQGGARGHSKAEDAMDLIMKLARPEGYVADEGARFQVTFEKARGVFGPAVAPFEAQLTATGWQSSATEAAHSPSAIAARLLEAVRLHAEAGEPLKSATKAIAAAQVRRAAGLAAWKMLIETGKIHLHPSGGFRVA
ncbi:MAG: AAA family ATPase [Vicinamibacterales bacterium]